MLKKLFFICICCLFTGCKTTQSLTFDVSTQDQIEVSIHNHYDLKTDQDNFLIYNRQNQKVAEGIFLPKETYESLLNEKSQVKVLEEDFKNKNPYFLCKVENDYMYVLYLKDSQTGILLTCSTSQKETKQIFENLDFKILENS